MTGCRTARHRPCPGTGTGDSRAARARARGPSRRRTPCSAARAPPPGNGRSSRHHLVTRVAAQPLALLAAVHRRRPVLRVQLLTALLTRLEDRARWTAAVRALQLV